MGLKFAGSNLDPLLNNLSKKSPLSDELRASLRGSFLRIELCSKEAVLDAGAGQSKSPRIIVRGWAARCQAMVDGRRQIFNFLVPGDVLLSEPNHTIVALTTVETVEISSLCALATPSASKTLLAACDVQSADQASLLFDHIVRLGQQNAVERMIDLFLELHRRLSVVGLGRRDGFDMPLKQEHLAESLGLTLVHINRTLQRLRAEGLLDFRDGKVSLLNPGGLSRLVNYGELPGERWPPSALADLMKPTAA